MSDGAEPVGNACDLTYHDRRLLRCIRVWMACDDYRDVIFRQMSLTPSSVAARRQMSAFDGFMASLAVSIPRELIRHGETSSCLGRDEATLLCLVQAATLGDRFTAQYHAKQLVRPDRIDAIIDAAEWLGQSLQNGVETESNAPRVVHRSNETLH